MNRIPVITGMAGVVCGGETSASFHSVSNEKMTNHQLLDLAFNKAVTDSGIELEKLQEDENTGIIIGTTNGLFYEQSLFLKEFYKKGRKSPMLFSQSANNFLLDTIVSKYKIKGFSSCLFNGWTSALDAIQLGCNMIRNGSLDTVIIGCVDILDPIVLTIYDKFLGNSESLCYKIDGFSLQEGSGVIIIEEKNKGFIKKNYKGIITGGGQSSFYSEAEYYTELECVIKNINSMNYYYANLNHTNLDALEVSLIKKYCLRLLNSLKLSMGEYGAVSGILQVIEALNNSNSSSLIVNACYSGRLSWLLVDKECNNKDAEERKER